MKVKLPSATKYMLDISMDACDGLYFKYEIKMGGEVVKTQNMYVPAGRHLHQVFEGVFYAPTYTEAQSGALPDGVASEDLARGSNVITITFTEFRDKTEPDNMPTYRSLGSESFSFGSTIREQARTFDTVATPVKNPTGKLVMFKLQLSHASTCIHDHKLRNLIFNMNEEKAVKIAGLESERDAANKADDELIQRIMDRKRARAPMLARMIDNLHVEYAVKEQGHREKRQASAIDDALD